MISPALIVAKCNFGIYLGRDGSKVGGMKTNDIKNGQRVKLVFGFGRVVFGQISDTIANKLGKSYEVTTDEGDVEYVSGFNSQPGIGAFLV